MRVIAGRFRGRKLRAAPEAGVRPTSDRVRESMFASLGPLDGARVLDAYAGTGALGIEALSRGAASVVFCERARRALATLRGNLELLGLAGDAAVEVHAGEARAVLDRLARVGRRFDLVLLDPPYRGGEAARVLPRLAAGDLLAPDARIVLECGVREPPEMPPGLAVDHERRYGDTLVRRLVPVEAQGEPIHP